MHPFSKGVLPDCTIIRPQSLMPMARSWAVTLGTQHMVPKAMVDANTSLKRSIRTDLRASNKEGCQRFVIKESSFPWPGTRHSCCISSGIGNVTPHNYGHSEARSTARELLPRSKLFERFQADNPQLLGSADPVLSRWTCLPASGITVSTTISVSEAILSTI